MRIASWIKAVRITLRRKLNNNKHQKRIIQELKGTGTTIEVKSIFWKAKKLSLAFFYNTEQEKSLRKISKDKPRYL